MLGFFSEKKWCIHSESYMTNHLQLELNFNRVPTEFNYLIL